MKIYRNECPRCKYVWYSYTQVDMHCGLCTQSLRTFGLNSVHKSKLDRNRRFRQNLDINDEDLSKLVRMHS